MSLQSRYIIIIVTLTVVSVSTLGALLLYQFSRSVNELTEASLVSSTKYLRNQIDKRGHVITRFLSENLINPLYRYDMEAIYELITNVQAQSDIKYIYVYDISGKLIHDGSEHLTKLGKNIDNQQIVDAIQKQGEVFSEVKSDTKLYAMPIWVGDEPIGGVMVAISLNAITEDVSALKSRMGEVGMDTISLNTKTVVILITILATISAFFSVIIANHLIKPIKQLINQTVSIKNGMYGATIDIEREDELGDLLHSFNDMSRELEHTTVSKIYMDNIFDSMSDTLVVLRPDYSIELVNKALCRLLDYEKKDLIGRPFNVLFDKEEINGLLHNVFTEGEIIAQNMTYVNKDGFRRSISMSAAIMNNSNGTKMRIICVAQDNTERIKLQKKLMEAKDEAESANSAKSEFLSRMSHELRTPMNAILGFGQLLEYDHENLSAAQISYVTHIMGGGEHLLRLINEVLDIAQVDTANMNLFIETVSLNQIINSSVLLVSPLAKANGVILPAMSNKTFYVQADKLRLKQALVNFLSNAVKYNCENGSVDVSIVPVLNGYIRINISDTGQGIKSEDQEQIFEPFMRVGGSSQTIEGTGLGLTITKKIVELMNGQVGFNSVYGKGSTFWIDLPQATEINEEDIQGVSSSLTTNICSDKLKVLYIEDNLTNLVLIEELLRKIVGCEFIGASNAEDGIDLARDGQPNLILMDIELPGMNGFDALEVLKADKDTSHIPVIAISAHAMVKHVEKGNESDFSYYLTKPIDTNKLMELINNAAKK